MSVPREVTHGGRTQSLTAWATELGIPYACLVSRFLYGWTAERVLSTPVDLRKRRRKAR